MLPENEKLALGQLRSCLQRLKDPDHFKKLDAIIQNQLELEIIEEVKEDTELGEKFHYLPHHAVITPQKETTKVRIVYNESAKTKKENLSLNELLYRGPNMLPDLCGLLMRFRLPKVAIIADIEKAFLQVGIQIKDRDVLRFFWVRDPNRPVEDKNNQVILRFCRVPFGVISSPFLLAATIRHHLGKSDSKIAKSILSNIYVDNVLHGVDSTEEGYQFYLESKALFKIGASMNLREYTSNDAALLDQLPPEDRSKAKIPKVMGLYWSIEGDTLSVPGADSFNGMFKRKGICCIQWRIFLTPWFFRSGHSQIQVVDSSLVEVGA